MIRINGYAFDVVLDSNSADTTIISSSDYTNQSPDFNSGIFSKDPKEMEYVIRASHNKKWIVDQLFLNSAIVTISDVTLYKTLTAWITKIQSEKDFLDSANPHLITLSIYVITESAYSEAYIGFEKINESEKFEDGFERIYI